jgi:surfactin synthase thioesterase subunit
VATIQLPGRGSYCSETPLNTIEAVIQGLFKEFTFWLDKPFLLFGHSLGALVIFELSKKLMTLSALPEHLIISGCRAPHMPLRRKPISALPNNEFIAELLNYNGTPKELLEHQELIDLFLPTLRADFTIAESYRCLGKKEPLPFNITTITGNKDPNIYENDVKEWKKYTRQNFKYYVLPGDHFFINAEKLQVINIIKEIISNILDQKKASTLNEN